MTTRVSTSLRIAAFLWIAIGVTAGSAIAQTPLTGTYVFSERGSETSTLAWLMFAADGSATGNAVRQQGVVVTTYALQGAYVANADSSTMLTVSGTSLDTVDTNGNPLVFNEVLMMIPAANKSFGTLRTDAGQDVGEMIPAMTGALASGSYQISGRPVDPADTSIELVNVDNAGAVTGQKVTNSYGLIVQKSLSGSAAATAAGFQGITVNVSFTDADGNPQTATETYLALQTQKNVRMIQTGGGPTGLLTLSQ